MSEKTCFDFELASLNKPQSIYKLFNEPWIWEDSLVNAKRWDMRYKEWVRHDYYELGLMSKPECRFHRVCGLMGEYIFDGILDSLNVAHIWAKPYYPRKDPRGGRDFDFKIENMRVEIKTVGPIKEHLRLMVAKKGYTTCDVYVAIKLFFEDKGIKALKEMKEEEWSIHMLKKIVDGYLMGWLSHEKLENNHKPKDFGMGLSYWEFLNNLNPMPTFWEKIGVLPASMIGDNSIHPHMLMI